MICSASLQGPAVFLASDDSSYVTAAVLNVTGEFPIPCLVTAACEVQSHYCVAALQLSQMPSLLEHSDHHGIHSVREWILTNANCMGIASRSRKWWGKKQLPRHVGGMIIG